ncbi:MAG: cysteine hydrolase [Candidatus Thiodiazotropha sp.]
MQQALILIDLINELIAPGGKLSAKGYTNFADQHGTLGRIADLLNHSRSQAHKIIHVRVGFSPDYREQPKDSPLFKHASRFDALKLGEWGTEFVPQATPLPGETVLVKHRVNAFYGTPLEILLRNAGIDQLAIVGCSTDVGVQTTARAAHDLDYACTVIGDCCIAPSDEDHEPTLRMLSKVVQVSNLEQFMNP